RAIICFGVASIFAPLQCLVNSNSSRCSATAASTAFAASLPVGNVEAARTQRTITPEYMCHGCECRRTLMVILSEPVAARVSSSLANALAEYGQVGSRNISNCRGPRPQVSGLARQVLIASVILSLTLADKSRPSVGHKIHLMQLAVTMLCQADV